MIQKSRAYKDHCQAEFGLLRRKPSCQGCHTRSGSMPFSIRSSTFLQRHCVRDTPVQEPVGSGCCSWNAVVEKRTTWHCLVE
ncbi:Mannan endo-1,6-alpha-mannosidase DCW1 [Fusarium oxysporum f. sp. albedinis]|nr:Mannan endo-1,6-alpha-mannosidase DCW1 [Fusarium oxysporum f. sp. albedinis]